MRSGVMSTPIGHCMPTRYCLISASARSRLGKSNLASMTSATRDSPRLVTRMSGWNAMVVAFSIQSANSRARRFRRFRPSARLPDIAAQYHTKSKERPQLGSWSYIKSPPRY